MSGYTAEQLKVIEMVTEGPSPGGESRVWLPHFYEGFACAVALGSSECNPTPYQGDSRAAKLWLDGWALGMKLCHMRYSKAASGHFCRECAWRTGPNGECQRVPPHSASGWVMTVTQPACPAFVEKR